MSQVNLQDRIVATHHVNLDNDPSTVEFIAIVDMGRGYHNAYEVDRNGRILDPQSPLSVHKNIDINFDGKPEGDSLYIERDGALTARSITNLRYDSDEALETARYGRHDILPTNGQYDLNKDGQGDGVTTGQPIINTHHRDGYEERYETLVTITPTWTPDRRITQEELSDNCLHESHRRH